MTKTPGPSQQAVGDLVADLVDQTATVATQHVRVHPGECPPAPDPTLCRCGHLRLAHRHMVTLVDGRRAPIAETPEQARLDSLVRGNVYALDRPDDLDLYPVECVPECSCRTWQAPPAYRWQTRCGRCGELIEAGAGTVYALEQRTVMHPSLLEQLVTDIGGSGESTPGGSSWESRPPVRLDAASAYREISDGARAVVGLTLHRQPGSVEENLRAIATRAHLLSAGELRVVVGELRRWVVKARLATGWDTPPRRVQVPCMVCGVVGSLLVRVDPMAAECSGCGSTWDATTIGILGEHLRLAASPEPVGIPDSRQTVAAPAELPDDGPAQEHTDRLLAGLVYVSTAEEES